MTKPANASGMKGELLQNIRILPWDIAHNSWNEKMDMVESGKRKLLVGSGWVSHDEALKKAKQEYRKYQELTLSSVEEEYLKSIKGVKKEVKKRARSRKEK